MKDYERIKIIGITLIVLLTMSLFMNFVQRMEIERLYEEMYKNQLEYKRVLSLWNNCEKESVELIKKNYDCSTREVAKYIKFFERLYKIDQDRKKRRVLINYKEIKGGGK